MYLVDTNIWLERLLDQSRSEDVRRLVQVAEQFRLDFDDAYQCVVAETHNLTLISFDSDFDHTDTGRRDPMDVLAKPETRQS